MEKLSKPLILSVDDDPEILTLVQRFLESSGYEVLVADRVSEALDILENIRPDLILLDVTMPEMTGYEFCARLQSEKEFSLIPVVFLSVLESQRDKAMAFAAGAVDYLTKPVSKSKLIATVEKHLQTKSRWAGLAPRKTRIFANNYQIHPELQKFKRFLLTQFKLPSEKINNFHKIQPHEIYDRSSDIDLDSTTIAQCIAKFLQLPYLSELSPDNLQLGILPTRFCKSNNVLALTDSFGQNALALSNPFRWDLMDSLRVIIGDLSSWQIYITEPGKIGAILEKENTKSKSNPPVEISLDAIEAKLSREYQENDQITQLPDVVNEESKPIILFVNRIIEEAYNQGASDIHIEPWQDAVVVRYRIDGHLRIARRLHPQNVIRPLVARIKIMSKLNIAEKRLPQDGRIVFSEFSIKNLDFDLRVATAPMNFGEKVVMRILDKTKSVMSLTQLGFSAANIELYKEKIQVPYGMVLHVGPTGSGKSMTLYAALNEIKRPQINIQTAEDPIEYTLPGISQMQIKPDIGLTFKTALRSFLRQDPDVILVGEIRDFETAKIAVEAALTGHMLFSTLHTNDAAATVTRFIEMGIEPFLVSSSIVLICAQRLLRRLCNNCKQPRQPSSQEKKILALEPFARNIIYQPKGCDHCNNIGYKGRIGIHEIMVPDEKLRLAINKKGITAEEIKMLAVTQRGMITLYWDAMAKVLGGICSLDDALGGVRADEFDSCPLATSKQNNERITFSEFAEEYLESGLDTTDPIPLPSDNARPEPAVNKLIIITDDEQQDMQPKYQEQESVLPYRIQLSTSEKFSRSHPEFFASEDRTKAINEASRPRSAEDEKSQKNSNDDIAGKSGPKTPLPAPQDLAEVDNRQPSDQLTHNLDEQELVAIRCNSAGQEATAPLPKAPPANAATINLDEQELVAIRHNSAGQEATAPLPKAPPANAATINLDEQELVAIRRNSAGQEAKAPLPKAPANAATINLDEQELVAIRRNRAGQGATVEIPDKPIINN